MISPQCIIYTVSYPTSYTIIYSKHLLPIILFLDSFAVKFLSSSSLLLFVFSCTVSSFRWWQQADWLGIGAEWQLKVCQRWAESWICQDCRKERRSMCCRWFTGTWSYAKMRRSASGEFRAPLWIWEITIGPGIRRDGFVIRWSQVWALKQLTATLWGVWPVKAFLRKSLDSKVKTEW